MALVEASEGGDLDEVRRLLDAGADHDAVDELSRSAAHYAAAKGHLEIVQLLRARGANLDGRDFEGLTPFAGQHVFLWVANSLLRARGRRTQPY